MKIYSYNGQIIYFEESRHIKKDRRERTKVIENLMRAEKAEIANSFRVDNGHKNGAEIHVIYSNAVIRIYNEETNKHITDLIARPGQVRRYFIATGKSTPQGIIAFAKEHEKKGLNK